MQMTVLFFGIIFVFVQRKKFSALQTDGQTDDLS